MAVRAPVAGKYISLTDVLVIGIFISIVFSLAYSMMSQPDLDRALAASIISTNLMVILSVSGIMYFIVKRIK